MNDLEKLIALAKVVAKPWCICTWILAFLLCLSILINAYLITHSSIDLDLLAENNSESEIIQSNK